MNKIIKRGVAMVAALGLAAIPIFAHGGCWGMRGNWSGCWGNGGCWQNDGWRGQFQNFTPPAPNGMRGYANDTRFMGTVSSVDAGTAVIVVKDSDGNDTRVHINPYTRIFVDGAWNQNAPGYAQPAATLDNISAGDWVAVVAYVTDTETREAADIRVARQ